MRETAEEGENGGTVRGWLFDERTCGGGRATDDRRRTTNGSFPQPSLRITLLLPNCYRAEVFWQKRVVCSERIGGRKKTAASERPVGNRLSNEFASFFVDHFGVDLVPFISPSAETPPPPTHPHPTHLSLRRKSKTGPLAATSQGSLSLKKVPTGPGEA